MKSARQTAVLAFAVFFVLALASARSALWALQEVSPTRFQPAINAFLEADKVNPPPRQAILFIGSSVFRQWESLEEQMAPLPVLYRATEMLAHRGCKAWRLLEAFESLRLPEKDNLEGTKDSKLLKESSRVPCPHLPTAHELLTLCINRAFGGSRTGDVLYYVDQIVLPYEPAIIAYYCGSNDINAGEEAGAISGRFREFVARVHAKLPDTRVFFVSINRAPQKQDRWDVVDEANRQVRAYCLTDTRLGFIDVNPALFDREGNPRLELYQEDKLHFKPQAYAEFTAIIKPIIAKAWGE